MDKRLPFSSFYSDLFIHFLVFFHLDILPSFLFCVSYSFLFCLYFHIFLNFLFTFHAFFLSLCSFNPTFRSIPHNNHPQLMALPGVKVHNTQSWVRAMTRLFSSLVTFNLCFLHKLRFTYPRIDQGQHIVPKKN